MKLMKPYVANDQPEDEPDDDPALVPMAIIDRYVTLLEGFDIDIATVVRPLRLMHEAKTPEAVAEALCLLAEEVTRKHPARANDMLKAISGWTPKFRPGGNFR